MRRSSLMWAFGAGLTASYLLTRRHPNYDYSGRVIVITGGSRGLGLVMARELVREGARVVLLARKEAELSRAKADIISRGGTAYTYSCDITLRNQVEEAFEAIGRDIGRVDVLINNAGVIQSGGFENQNEEDFDLALATHLYGPLYATWAALPLMKQQGHGRIVNISSIGGKLSIPHLLPYSASKFALAGLSEGLRAELKPYNITVTTVCPGLMRTGSHNAALFKGRHADEFAWFALMDSLPVLSINARSAARKILKACREGRAQLVFPWHYRIAVISKEVMPGLTSRANALFDSTLPQPGESETTMKGYEARQASPPRWVTHLSDRAAKENNEPLS